MTAVQTADWGKVAVPFDTRLDCTGSCYRGDSLLLIRRRVHVAGQQTDVACEALRGSVPCVAMPRMHATSRVQTSLIS